MRSVVCRGNIEERPALKEDDMEVLFGPYGGRSLEYAERFSGCGANAVWFHGFNPSAFETCEKHGIAACVEFSTFRADFNKRPELIPTGPDGNPIRFGSRVQGVCLSRKEFLQEIEEELVQGVSRFRPTGIWLDYLTSAGWFETPEPDLQESCFCEKCIKEFCEHTGVDADDPELILSAYKEEWHRFTCERIAKLAARYAEIIRDNITDCTIGAYMCPWTPFEFDGALTGIFGQDYNLLSPSVDLFTPLIYAKKCGSPPEWPRMFLEECRSFIPEDNEVQLILDMLDFPESLFAAAESSVPSRGIQIFSGAQIFDKRETYESFRKGVGRLHRRISCLHRRDR